MRPLGELARLCNDALLRMRQYPRPWLLAGVSAAAASALIGTAVSWPSIGTTIAERQVTAPQTTRCTIQTWPNLTGACLRQERGGVPDGRSVRMIAIEPGSASAVGISPWAAKATSSNANPSSPKREVTRRDRSLAVPDRAGSNKSDAAPQRRRQAPMDSAFRAYGYAR
jgi:hypothetical protein